MPKLNARFVATAPPGKYEDGGGLRLVKRKEGGGQWVFRYSLHQRRREMGLGSLAALPLKDARAAAAECRTLVAKGIDPIDRRDQLRADAKQAHKLFSDVALDAFDSRKAELKGDGKAGRWFSPLELHVLPKIGRLPISSISQRHIRDVLKPIWHTKAATAKKAADRLKVVFEHAAALGLDVDLQAVAKAKALLGRQRHEVQSVPSSHGRTCRPSTPR